MKILRKTMLIFSAVLLTTACSKSGIEEIDPNAPEHNDGTTKTLSLSVPAMIGETRAGTDASDVEKAIDDVWVLQYLTADGKLFDGKAQHFTASEITDTSSGKTVSASLDDAASTVYVIANVGAAYADFAEDKVPQTLTEFEKLSYTFPAVFAEGELTSGTLPMVGSATIEAGATSVPVTLKRMVAKIDFTITVDASAPSDLKLTSAHLEYVSNKTAFKAGPTTLPTARVQPAAADANFFDAASDKTFVYGTAKTIDVSKSPTTPPTGGATLTWYVPENLAGQKEGLSSAKQKGPGNLPDDYCTRIVVKGTATYQGTANTEVSFYIYPGADAIKDFNIERNKIYTITSNIKNVNKGDNRVQVHDFIDLSADDASNCYMIHKAGKYKFRCDIKGNGTNEVGGQTPIDTSVGSADIEVNDISTVEILWEMTGSAGNTVTKNTVIKVGTDGKSILERKNDYIMFESPDEFKEGNALIVVKNASGDILWSWHIWSTAYEPDKYYDVYTTAGRSVSGQKPFEDVMRCNLGATNSGQKGTDNEGSATVAGFWYQWGRKDPFRHNVASSAISAANEPTTMAEAIKHPTQFYRANSSPYDWRSGQNNYLWGNPNVVAKNPNTDRGIKTMYDPCPVGWKVAPQDLWNSLSLTKGTILIINNANATRDGAQAEIKYYSAGYLNTGTGAVTGVASEGDCWSSSPFSGHVYAGYLRFDSGGVYPLNNNSRAFGFSVRCVRETQRASR